MIWFSMEKQLFLAGFEMCLGFHKLLTKVGKASDLIVQVLRPAHLCVWGIVGLAASFFYSSLASYLQGHTVVCINEEFGSWHF